MLTGRDVAEIRGDLHELVLLARTAVDLLTQLVAGIANLVTGEQAMATSLHDLVTAITQGLADVGTKLDANTAALAADGAAITALVGKLANAGVAQEDLDALSAIAARVTATGQTVDAQTTSLSQIAATIAGATPAPSPAPAPTTPAQ